MIGWEEVKKHYLENKFGGKDQSLVDAHVEELEALGFDFGEIGEHMLEVIRVSWGLAEDMEMEAFMFAFGLFMSGLRIGILLSREQDNKFFEELTKE